MDSSHTMNSVKRKRRKTRKCLDELRKRSRYNAVELPNETGSKTLSKNKENVYSNRIKPSGISNCNITSNRLTLRPNLLSKSIKSETITRPLLAQSNVKPDIIINKFKETKVIQQEINPSRIETTTSVVSKTVLQENSNKTNSTSEKDGHDSDAITFNIESDSDSVNNSPNSFFLFSPISQPLENEVKSRSPLAGSSHKSTASSPGSEHFGYDLYRDFMSALPKYLHENVPCLFEVDVVKKVKDSLLNIYTEECQKESEQNIFKCLNSATQKGKDSNSGPSAQKKEKASSSCLSQESILKSFDHSTRQSSIANANNSLIQKNHSFPSSMGLPEAIIENPVEYIKANMARAQQRRAMLEPPSRSHLSIDSDTTPSPAPPSRPPRTPPSPRPSTSRPTVTSVIHDTPEYTYYPRKLNL